MKYYGYTEEGFNKMVTLLNQISVTGINQTDAFHEATAILRKPVLINADEKEAKENGKAIRKD